MEKIRIFTGCAESDGFGSLETEINEWIATRDQHFHIVDKKVAICVGVNASHDPFVNCTIVVTYTQ